MSISLTISRKMVYIEDIIYTWSFTSDDRLLDVKPRVFESIKSMSHSVWGTVIPCMYTVILSRWSEILKFLQNPEDSWIHTRCNGFNGVIPLSGTMLHPEQDYRSFQYFLQLYFVIWCDLLWNLIEWFYLKSIFRDAEWILRINRNEHDILRLWSEHPYLYLSKTEKILTK